MKQLFFDSEVKNQLNQSYLIRFETLLAYRVIVVIIMSGIIFDQILRANTFTISFVFMTLWGGYLNYCYQILSFVENLSYFLNSKKQFFGDSLWQSAHITFTLAFSIEIPVFFMYWGYVYPQSKPETIRDTISNFNLHGTFCLFIVIDEIINNIQIIKRHFPLLVLVSIIYSSINASYSLTHDDGVYPGVTWRNVISIILVPSAALAIYLTYLFAYFIYIKFKAPKIRKQQLECLEKLILT